MIKKSTDNTTPSEERAEDARSGIQVIRRAVTVLRMLAGRSEKGLSLGEIAAGVNLPRSTVQRIVGALEEEGMAAQATSGGFCLGPTVGVLARGMGADPVDAFHSEMTELHATLNESVILNTIADGRVLVLEVLSSTKPLRVVLPKVLEVDLLTSAPGKAVLAILPEEAREAAISAAGRPFDRATLLAQLEEARRAGYAVEEDEPYEGISALAIALPMGGKPYAITVALPSGRFAAERAVIAKALLASAATLARRLSGTRN
jgi:DNA-binding IclR family transcriptional regulator